MGFLGFWGSKRHFHAHISVLGCLRILFWTIILEKKFKKSSSMNWLSFLVSQMGFLGFWGPKRHFHAHISVLGCLRILFWTIILKKKFKKSSSMNWLSFPVSQMGFLG